MSRNYIFSRLAAKMACNKGDLLLVPCGELVPRPTSAKKNQLGENNVHEAHLPTVPFIVSLPPAKAQAKAKAKSKGAGEGKGSQPQSAEGDEEKPCPRMEMLMLSPAISKSFLPDKHPISPYWAVCRLSRASHEASNMDIFQEPVNLEFPKAAAGSPAGLTSGAALPKLCVSMIVLRNTKKIAIGDGLTLPFHSEKSKLVF